MNIYKIICYTYCLVLVSLHDERSPNCSMNSRVDPNFLSKTRSMRNLRGYCSSIKDDDMDKLISFHALKFLRFTNSKMRSRNGGEANEAHETQCFWCSNEVEFDANRFTDCSSSMADACSQIYLSLWFHLKFAKWLGL